MILILYLYFVDPASLHIEFCMSKLAPLVKRTIKHTNGLMQERRNSSALAMELRLSCTHP